MLCWMTAKGFGIQDPRVSAVHFANAARAQLTNASTRHLHCGTGCILICHLEGSGANLIAILLHQIFKAARIAGRCDEAIRPMRAQLQRCWPKPLALPVTNQTFGFVLISSLS